jgi:hypothetical protein
MNNTRNIIFTCISIILLAACAPSAQAVQIAVGKTQAAMPAATAYPTYTLFPTYTPFPPTPYPTKIPFVASISTRLVPGIAGSLIYAVETGTEIFLDFPKDATLQPARVMLIPGLSSIYPPTLVYHGEAFDLLAGPGDQMEGFKAFNFNAPVSVTIKFASSQNLDTLALYTWTGSDWVKVETICNLPLPSLDASANTIKTSICSPGSFAIFSPNGG